MKRIILPIAFLTALLALVTACSRHSNAIIGTWSSHSQVEYGTERTEFFKDGACFIESRGQRITGAWSALDDGRIRVTMTLGAGPGLTMFAAVTGDELVIDGGTNNRTAYVRDQSQRAKEILANVQRAVSEREIRIEAEKRAIADRQEAERRERSRQQEADRIAREQEAAEARLHSEARKKNSTAWSLLSSSDTPANDVKRALELALQAVKVEPNNHEWLDTLAVAYSRIGDFDNAIATQKRAIAISSSSEYSDRLILYQQKRAYLP